MNFPLQLGPMLNESNQNVKGIHATGPEMLSVPKTDGRTTDEFGFHDLCSHCQAEKTESSRDKTAKAWIVVGL